MDNTAFSEFAFAGLPIALLIAVGFMTRRYLVPEAATWESLNRVNFRLLIPALIIGTIIETDLPALSGARIVAAILLALFVIALFLTVMYRILVPARMDTPAFTSLFQTSTRWNAAIALVVTGLLFDQAAIAVIAVIMVVLIPIVNVLNITMMIRLQDGGDKPSLARMVGQIVQNPIILGCLIGALLSMTQLNFPDSVMKSLDILGVSSIGTVLLSLGAGLSAGTFRLHRAPIALSCLLKLLVMPALVFAFGKLLGMPPEMLTIATIATAMPTATNGYVVAQEMGGDAPLYASICSVQTLLSFATAPLWLIFCLSWPG